MSSKKMLGIALGSIAFIAFIIGVSIFYSKATWRNPKVAFPDASASVSDGLMPSGSDNPSGGPETVTVTRDTVQAVVAALNRPSDYQRNITVSEYWTGGSLEYNIGVSALDGNIRLVVSGGDAVENIIETGSAAYIWYNGDRKYYKTSAGSTDAQTRLSDELQMLVSYTDVLKLSAGAIKDAGYTIRNGEGCVYVSYVSGTMGYTTDCYISAQLGLVVEAEIYDGDALIYKMTAGSCSRSAPDNSVFDLPDGKNALTSP